MSLVAVSRDFLMKPGWSDVRSDRLPSCDACAISDCDDDFFIAVLAVCVDEDRHSRLLSGRRLLFDAVWFRGFRTLEFLHLITSSGKRIQSSIGGDIMGWWSTTSLMVCLIFVGCRVRLDDCCWLISQSFLELDNDSMAVKRGVRTFTTKATTEAGRGGPKRE